MGKINQDDLQDALRKPKERKPKEKIKSNKISEILEERDMTQQELADISGLLPQHLSAIINGKRKSISLPTAFKIARALDMQVEEVFEY